MSPAAGQEDEGQHAASAGDGDAGAEGVVVEHSVACAADRHQDGAVAKPRARAEDGARSDDAQVVPFAVVAHDQGPEARADGAGQ